MIPTVQLADFTALLHNILSMDKDTLHMMGYACYVYIMMDRFNHKARTRH